MGCCGWILTIFSVLIVICTFPFSLLFCIKVGGETAITAPKMKFSFKDPYLRKLSLKESLIFVQFTYGCFEIKLLVKFKVSEAYVESFRGPSQAFILQLFSENKPLTIFANKLHHRYLTVSEIYL